MQDSETKREWKAGLEKRGLGRGRCKVRKMVR